MCCTPQKTVPKGPGAASLGEEARTAELAHGTQTVCVPRRWLCVLAAEPGCCNLRQACILGQPGHWRVNGGFSVQLRSPFFRVDFTGRCPRGGWGLKRSVEAGLPVSLTDRSLFQGPPCPTHGDSAGLLGWDRAVYAGLSPACGPGLFHSFRFMNTEGLAGTLISLLCISLSLLACSLKTAK